jgi:hypothetical protein
MARKDTGFGPGKYAAKAVLNWEGVPDSKRSLKQTWVFEVTYLGEDGETTALLFHEDYGGRSAPMFGEGIWKLEIYHDEGGMQNFSLESSDHQSALDDASQILINMALQGF